MATRSYQMSAKLCTFIYNPSETPYQVNLDNSDQNKNIILEISVGMLIYTDSNF